MNSIVPKTYTCFRRKGGRKNPSIRNMATFWKVAKLATFKVPLTTHELMLQAYGGYKQHVIFKMWQNFKTGKRGPVWKAVVRNNGPKKCEAGFKNWQIWGRSFTGYEKKWSKIGNWVGSPYLYAWTLPNYQLQTNWEKIKDTLEPLY